MTAALVRPTIPTPAPRPRASPRLHLVSYEPVRADDEVRPGSVRSAPAHGPAPRNLQSGTWAGEARPAPGPPPLTGVGGRATLGSRPVAPRLVAHQALDPAQVRARDRTRAAHRQATVVVRIALEILDGRRPLQHLARHATPAVLRYLAAGPPGRTTSSGPKAPDARAGALRSLHVSLPGRADAEVAAVCRVGGRIRALAAHLERTPAGDWHCTTLRIL